MSNRKTKQKQEEFESVINEAMELFDFGDGDPEFINTSVELAAKKVAKKMQRTSPEMCLRVGITMGMRIIEKRLK